VALLALLYASCAPAAEPVVLVQDPAVLAAFSLPVARSFGAGTADLDNQALYKASSAYRALVDSLANDLAELKAQDPRLDVTMAKIHRLFDARWLKAPSARFELVGVANRLDRKPFAPATCGETRLVYRLAYRKSESLHSRLPMTLNVVHWVRGDCKAEALRWMREPSLLASGEGPLSAARIEASPLKAIEVNLQSVRWPSTVRGDLGGHAEYLLRVFTPAGGSLVLGTMENTPDVARLEARPALRQKLETWIKEHLSEIDAGTAVLPEEFLARKATSVSPRGLARLANRPFTRLLKASDFSQTAFSKRRYVRSAKALLRRLDDLSCVGCHQGRSVAGFHLIGIDRPETVTGNAIAVSGSPHLLGDLERRRDFVRRLAEGAAPVDARPLSEHADQGEGGHGSHCGLGDTGLAEWKCLPGYQCRAVGLAPGDDTVGQCFADFIQVGDPCEVGALVPHADPHRDKIVSPKVADCRGVCEANHVGFPDGMCALSVETARPFVEPGHIALLAGFNACLGAGKPFPECLKEHVRPAGLRYCSDKAPCRDDYLCTRGPRAGVCLPPYFLFQMRVDGHPKPL
jgi:hypothetical protein